MSINDDDDEWITQMITELDQNPSDDEEDSLSGPLSPDGGDLPRQISADFTSWSEEFSVSECSYPDDLSEVNITEPCNDRLVHVSLPSPLQQKLDQLQEKLLLYTTDYYVWEPVYMKDGVSGTRRESEKNRMNIIRGQIFLPFTISEIASTLVDTRLRKEIDPSIESCPPISWKSDHTGIEYIKYKPVWPTAPRDSCAVTHWRLLKNGLFLWYGFSEESELYPEQPGVIRSHIELVGYVMRHVPGGTMLFLIVETDLGGKIPKSVASLILVSKPLCLLNLRKILEGQYPRLSNELKEKYSVYPCYDEILKSIQERIKHSSQSLQDNLWSRFSSVQIEQMYRVDPNLLRQGLLLRRSNKTHEWNIFYFTLDTQFLHHFLHFDDDQPYHSFHLNSSEVQIICHSAEDHVSPNGMGIYPFEISHPNTSTFYLAAPSSAERQEWIEDIDRVRHSEFDSDSRSSFSVSTPQFNEKTQKFFSIDLHSIPYESIEEDKVYQGLDESMSRKLDSAVVSLMKSRASPNKSSDDGWEKFFEGSGLKCFRRMDRGLMSIRGEIFFPYSIPEIFRSILDRQLRLKIQPDIDACPPIKWLSKHTGIEYLRYKPVWPTAPRDYCNLLHWRLLTDGTLLLFASSEPSHHYPTQQGLVRAQLYVGGYVMEHIPGGTNVSLLVQVDVGGHIPKAIANFIIAKRPAMLLNLKASLDRAWLGKERPDLSQPKVPQYEGEAIFEIISYLSELLRIASEVEENACVRTNNVPPASFSEPSAKVHVLNEDSHRLSTHTYLKEGLLYKQTDILKHWNPRYFTLDDSFLHYYHHLDDPLPRRSLQITNGMQIFAGEIKILNGIECYLFTISHPESLVEYHLAASSEMERQKWIAALANVIRDRHHGEHHPLRRSSESDRDSHISTDAAYEETDYILENYIVDQQHQNFGYDLSSGTLEVITGLEKQLLSLSPAHNNWTLFSEKEGTKIYSGVNGIRQETTLNYSIPDIYSIISNPKLQSSLDGRIESCRRLEDLNLHTWYEYQLFKSSWPLSPRDYCLLVNWRLLANGIFLYVISSQQHVECPLVEGVVREIRVLDGFIMKPATEGTHIIYISQSENKNVTSIEENEQLKRPFLLNNLRRILQENVERSQSQPPEILPVLIKISESNIDETTLHRLKHGRSNSEIPQHEEATILPTPKAQNPTQMVFDLPKLIEEKIESAVTRLMQYFEQNTLNNWEYLYEKEGVTVHRRNDISNCVRGETILPFTISEIFNLMRNPNHKRLLDGGIDVYFVLDVLNLHTHYEYIKLKGTWPLSPRDYCLLCHWRLLTDGTLITFSFSDALNTCPSFDGIVRGNILLDGYVFKHVVGGTKVVYFSQIDRQGSISTPGSNRNFQSKPMILHTMTTVLRTLHGKNQSYDQRMYHSPPQYEEITLIIQKHTDPKTFRRFLRRFETITQASEENYDEFEDDEIQPRSFSPPPVSSINPAIPPPRIYDPSTILPIQRIRLCVIFAMGLIFLQLFILPVSWTLIIEILLFCFLYYAFLNYRDNQKSTRASSQHIYRFKFDAEKLCQQLPAGVEMMASPFVVRALGKTLSRFPQFHGHLRQGRFHPTKYFDNFSISVTDCSFLDQSLVKMIEVIDVNHKQLQEINLLLNSQESEPNGSDNLESPKFCCSEVFPILISKLYDDIYTDYTKSHNLLLESSDALAHVTATNPLNRTLADMTLLPDIHSHTCPIHLMFTNLPLSSMVRRRKRMVSMTLVLNSSCSRDVGLKFISTLKENLSTLS